MPARKHVAPELIAEGKYLYEQTADAVWRRWRAFWRGNSEIESRRLST